MESESEGQTCREGRACDWRLKYGIATTVLMEHFIGKKQKEVCRKSESSFIHDYYAADPDSYEYMLSRGLDPHDRNQKLTDEERFDLYDELYFGDEDDYDDDRGFDDEMSFDAE